MGDILMKRAGEPVEAMWRHGRRRATFAQDIGGGMYANVVDGVLVGFGIEPVAGPFVSTMSPVRHHAVLVWAAPLAGAAAAAAGAVATGLMLRHRRIA